MCKQTWGSINWRDTSLLNGENIMVLFRYKSFNIIYSPMSYWKTMNNKVVTLHDEMLSSELRASASRHRGGCDIVTIRVFALFHSSLLSLTPFYSSKLFSSISSTTLNYLVATNQSKGLIISDQSQEDYPQIRSLLFFFNDILP